MIRPRERWLRVQLDGEIRRGQLCGVDLPLDKAGTQEESWDSSSFWSSSVSDQDITPCPKLRNFSDQPRKEALAPAAERRLLTWAFLHLYQKS